MTFVVYMLKCKDRSLYVGCTNNLKRRLHQHYHLKSGAHYTKQRRPVALVYKETYKTLNEARKREHAIKRFTRKKKLDLLNGNFANI